MNTIHEAIDALRAAERIAIATHVGPDGDASGSSLAMCLMLRKLGKDVRAYLRKADLGAPAVMEGTALFLDPAEADFSADTLLCLDCAARSRIAVPAFRDGLQRFKVVNVDHHESNDGFGDVNFVVPDASSTGELVWQMALAAGWEIDRPAAEALWVAVVTDTGRFSYSCTRPSTLECGADLLRRGVRQDFLNDELFSKTDLRVMRLRTLAYESLETWFNGKVAVIALDADAYLSTGCKKADSEDFVDIPRAVRGAEMAVFIYRSLPDERLSHISVRARKPFSAAALAKTFGGGGHDLAAGATLDGGVAEAAGRVKAALAAVFETQSPDRGR